MAENIMPLDGTFTLSVAEDGEIVVDSRLIAERLKIEHDNFLQTIQNYQSQIEQAFGILLFQTGKKEGRGRPPKFALLTEDQATFVMTLSRNTPEVVQCKLDLVKSFSAAKQISRQAKIASELLPEQRFALVASAGEQMLSQIQTFEAMGNLKLAQQMKHVLSYQLDRIAPMNALPAASVDRTEGAVDVAIRLGIRVPSNLEGTLGQHVKRQCGWLIQGKDSRISLKTGKNVPANQYPYGNTEVEQAVLGFCEQKGLI